MNIDAKLIESIGGGFDSRFHLLTITLEAPPGGTGGGTGDRRPVHLTWLPVAVVAGVTAWAVHLVDQGGVCRVLLSNHRHGWIVTIRDLLAALLRAGQEMGQRELVSSFITRLGGSGG